MNLDVGIRGRSFLETKMLYYLARDCLYSEVEEYKNFELCGLSEADRPHIPIQSLFPHDTLFRQKWVTLYCIQEAHGYAHHFNICIINVY